MIEILSYLLGFLALIMVITAIHEAGHFYVARFFKVKILDFSIGMGKSLKSWIGRDGTSYNLRLFPIGGYVKMLGEDVSDIKESTGQDSFVSKKYYQKVFILFAGPLANFILAVVIFTCLNIYGSTALSSKVGYILPESKAAVATIEEGDVILEVDGEKVETRAEVQVGLSRRLGESGVISFLIDSKGVLKDKTIPIQDWLIGEEPKDLLASLGIGLPITSEIGSVIKDGPAYRAGILAGDKINSIDAESVSSWGQIKKIINNSVGMPIEITLVREGKEIVKNVYPKLSDSVWIIGISSANKFSEDSFVYKSYSPITAFKKAVNQTYSTVIDSFVFLYKMITGYVSPKNLGGPVMIGQFAGETILYGGLYSFLMLMSFVSIGLGVINLVPIPILDGGQICLLTIEKIKGSPISPKTLDFVYRVGLSMVLFLMVFVFINDISRLSGVL